MQPCQGCESLQGGKILHRLQYKSHEDARVETDTLRGFQSRQGWHS